MGEIREIDRQQALHLKPGVNKSAVARNRETALFDVYRASGSGGVAHDSAIDGSFQNVLNVVSDLFDRENLLEQTLFNM